MPATLVASLFLLYYSDWNCCCYTVLPIIVVIIIIIIIIVRQGHRGCQTLRNFRTQGSFGSSLVLFGNILENPRADIPEAWNHSP